MTSTSHAARRRATSPSSRAAMVLLSAVGVVACGVILTLVTVAPAEAEPARPAVRTATTVAPTAPATTAATTVPQTDPPPTTVAETTPDTTPEATTPNSQPNQEWVTPSYEQPADTTPTYGNGSEQAATPPPTTDDVTMTTTQNLLVGPPPSTVTTTTIPAQDLTSKKVARQEGGSDPLLWAIVAGLGATGIALGVTTFLYWKRTHPESADVPPTGRGRRQSRYSDLVITVPKAP